MEKEELLSLVNELLGSTQLTLSEETIGGEVEDALNDITENTDTAAFAERLVGRLKRMDGNLHRDVANEVKKYKTDFAKKNARKAVEPKQEDDKDEPVWFARYRQEQENRIKAIEESRKQEEAQRKSDAIADSVKKTLQAKFKEANVTENSFVLKQTLRDMSISEDSNVEELVKQMEKEYYKNLKEAGFDVKKATPGFGGGAGGNKGKNAMDSFFAQKGKKEGWRKE